MDRIPARLADHPTVRKVLSRKSEKPGVIDADWLRQVCLDAGADDVAFASVENPDLASEREHVDAALPGTQSYISLVVKMNRDNVRSTARSVANQEFHRSGEIMNEAAHRITRALQDAGYRAINPSMSFPMEMDRFPGRIWVVVHKPVAVAAGLGVMGIHRNVIHPKFGNFILLGTILVAGTVSSYGEPLDYSPCLECKLCVAACPVGAIKKDGEFDFVACSVHNYREFMGGFTDWAQTIADSADADDFRARVSDSENASMWQSLSFKANYKAAYCLAVCPAGEDVIEPYLDDRKGFMDLVLKPLQEKKETLYVLPNSAAKEHAERRYPHKHVKVVDSGIRGRQRGYGMSLRGVASALCMKIVDVAALRAKSGRVAPLRRLLIGIAAVLISGVTLIALAVLPSGATGIASAQADPCSTVQVVFTRGTGEPDGTGRVGEAFVDALRPLVKGKSVAVYAVNYPATRDFLRAADGANDASLFVQNMATTCPDTKIVLGGYSQGAAIVDIITVADQPTLGFAQPMPANVADHVAAVAVFGNPSIRLLGGPLTTLSPLYGYKTIDLCNGADPVCSDGNDVAAHSLYVQAGLATQAAQFVADRITTQVPISTLAGQSQG